MFNVCLIQPPIEDFYGTPVRNIPLGPLSIGTSLKDKHNVQLLDLRQGKARRMEMPADLNAVKKYYRTEDTSPFALYKHYSRFGIGSRDIAAVAVMATVLIKMGSATLDNWRGIVIAIISVALTFGYRKIETVWIVTGAALLGYLLSLI